uniref:Uncharacterized protein n=1 Tax=Panagrolaimus sp. ES5 TaxID=591445 RepID=A0AC34GIH4_9BILA
MTIKSTDSQVSIDNVNENARKQNDIITAINDE